MKRLRRFSQAKIASIIAFSLAILVALAACAPEGSDGLFGGPVYPPEMSYSQKIISDFRSMIGADQKSRRDHIHQGIDIGGPRGQPIIAVADGEVIETHTEKCWGPTVMVDHGTDLNGEPLLAVYGHVGNILVEEGDTVSRGNLIARSGNNHHSYKCISGVRHLHLQFGRQKQYPIRKGDSWGHTYFLRDGSSGVNPHLLWADGPYQVTCFEEDRDYPPGTITYPVPCRN